MKWCFWMGLSWVDYKITMTNHSHFYIVLHFSILTLGTHQPYSSILDFTCNPSWGLCCSFMMNQATFKGTGSFRLNESTRPFFWKLLLYKVKADVEHNDFAVFLCVEGCSVPSTGSSNCVFVALISYFGPALCGIQGNLFVHFCTVFITDVCPCKGCGS